MSGRVLFVTWSGGGNVHPLVALGTRLLVRGHDVRVLGPHDLAARFAAEGIGFTAHRTGAEWTGGNPIVWPDVTDEQRSAYLNGLADDVIAEAARSPTDVLVVDYMQPDALCAAEKLGTPFVAFVHTLYTSVAADHESSPMNMSADVTHINALRGDLGLAPVPRITDLLDGADRVLVATVSELDRPDALPENVRYVGPLIEDAGPDARWRPPPGGGPLVVVSMGTTEMDEAPVLQRALDAMTDVPARAFVTVGDHLDASMFRTPPNASISAFVRHAAVLPHARVFVGHAGLGGISAALTFGVPLVCVPIGRDQPTNAAHVEAVGAGRTVTSDAGVEALRAGIVEVLHGDRYRTAAGRVADAIRANGSGARAVEELEQLVSSAPR